MQRSRNRLLGMPKDKDDGGERKVPSFKRMLYHFETGSVKAFFSTEDVTTAIESKQWVKSPALTNRGEFLKRPEVCKLYVDRKCSKELGCEEDKKIEVEPEKILPKPVALEREGSFKLEVPEDKKTEALEPILSKTVASEPANSLSEQIAEAGEGTVVLAATDPAKPIDVPENLGAPISPKPDPPKLKKALSQMSQPDLIEEGKLYDFEFTTNDTKMKMTKMIRAAKSKK